MINLLPPEYKEQQRFGRYNYGTVRYLVLIVIVTGLACSILLASSLIAQRSSRQLSTTIEQKQALVGDFEAVNTEAKALKTKIDNIATLIDNQSNFSYFLGELEEAVPPTARLKGVSLSHMEKSLANTTDEKNLQLTFDVISQGDIAVLQKSLEGMDRVEFVDLQTLTRNDTESNSPDFSVIFIMSLKQRPGEMLMSEAAKETN